MSLEITINTAAFDGLQHELAPLITAHQGRLWDAYLELDEDGVCSITQSAPWDNAVSVDVWHGRTRRWPLPARVAGRPLHATLTSLEVLELLQRVYLGHSIEWDGNNFRGVLDEDAQDAFDSLEAVIGELDNDESSQWVVWDADEWLAQAAIEEIWPEGLSLQVPGCLVGWAVGYACRACRQGPSRPRR
jgi:hypothetical protein